MSNSSNQPSLDNVKVPPFELKGVKNQLAGIFVTYLGSNAKEFKPLAMEIDKLINTLISKAKAQGAEEERERINEVLDEAYEIYGGGLFPPEMSIIQRAVVRHMKLRITPQKEEA